MYPKVSTLIAIALAVHLSTAAQVKAKPQTASITPFNLYDDTLVKLGELKQTVTSSILTAQTDLDAAKKSSSDYADEQGSKIQVEINDAASKNEGYIQDMVNLVVSVGKNPYDCIGLYRPNLDKILASSIDRVDSCIADVRKQLQNVVADAMDEANSAMDEVKNVEGQLLACGSGSIVCLSPVVRQIDADKIELPEAIEAAVHKASQLIDTLTNEIDGCTSSGVTYYETEANLVLGQLQQCFDHL